MCLSLQSALVSISVGSHVWVEDPTYAWVGGEVSKVNGEELHVRTTNGKTRNALFTRHESSWLEK
ncbi:putative myosin, SH3 [Lupinus albus]|uniref:Putative myosin, SH3 n=1 Tax=Lupinus albus TaxID=3870 RepID=A0A6A4PT17_LUPAL|nr:putative myosin, SH3 [Lupinus albus]